MKTSLNELKKETIREFIGRYSKDQIIDIIIRGMSQRDLNIYYKDALLHKKSIAKIKR